MSATLLAVQTPILQTLNNLVSQSLETMQQLARPPMPEASSQKERLEVPPRFGAGREAHEFRAIMSHYSHVSQQKMDHLPGGVDMGVDSRLPMAG